MGAVSTWWSTPAVPTHHFSEAELSASDRYHRPLRRAGLLSVVARLVALTGAALVAATVSGPVEPSWRRVVLGVVLVVVPMRVVAVAADIWFEYRHERLRPEHHPVPPWWFALVAVLLTALALTVSVPASWLGYRLVGVTSAWPWLLGGALVVGIVVFAALERPIRSRFDRLTNPERAEGAEPPLDGTDHREELHDLALLAHEFGLAGLPVEVRDDIDGDGGARGGVVGAGTRSIKGVNAYAAGVGPNRRIVVTRSLLSEPAPVREFVVAHELTHLARHHVTVQTLLSTGLALAGLAVVAVSVELARPWSWFGLDPLDPVGLPVLVLLLQVLAGPIGLATAWVSRAQERTADLGAIGVVGCPDGRSAISLHQGESADLGPPWWVRLFAHHPAPYERLEFLSRHR